MPFWILVAYCIMAALCVYGAAKLIKNGAADMAAYGKAVIASYLFYTALFAAVWIFDVPVPPYQIALTMLTVIGSCFFGHYLQLYVKSRTFDRYLHAFGTFSFALFTYSVVAAYVGTGGSRVFRALFVAFLGNTLGVIFELFEMTTDLNKNVPRSQKGLIDTDMDELFNLIGSALAGVFAYLWVLGE